jgi:hypothetical protein
MRMKAAPRSAQLSLMRSMICACTDTSSAVVGASAITSSGSAQSASAMTTRCRIPLEKACG